MNTQSPPPDQAEAEQQPQQPQAQQPQQQQAQQPQLPDPRRRLRELLSVPERDRTDAQWDEIVELEIQTAPGNRINPSAPMPGGGGGGGQPRQQQPQGQKKPHFKGQGGRQKQRNKPPKPVV
jgi:hypothetical protein